MSYSRLLGIVTENVFFACFILESNKCKTLATKPAFLSILTRVDNLQC